MLAWIREKFGKAMIGGIIGLIAFVFVFYGVFSPKSTRGLHEGSVAGTVNGDSISISDFNRELNRRLEFFKNIAGGKITDEQLKAFRIKETVFQELANRKLLTQEAKRQDLLAPEEQIREKIREIPAFQKNGKFDYMAYKQVLEANNYTPAGFERLIGEDLSVQQWEDFFKGRVHSSDEEARQEFLDRQEKRNIKYVLLTTESGQKKINIQDTDVKQFLSNPSQFNLVKAKFEEGKKTSFKGKSLEAVQESIARNLLASQKLEEIQKNNEKLADQVITLVNVNKAPDTKLNAFLKEYDVQVKSTGLVARQSNSLPGVGEAKEVLADAFASKSPINPADGGKAKKYLMAGRILVAMVSESVKPDLSKFEQEKESLLQQLTTRKVRRLYEDWMKDIKAQAKIDINPSVVGNTE